MPNVIKYAPGTTGPGVLYKGGFQIGNNTADYGSSFWNGITPPSNGYTIYIDRPAGGPSIVNPSDDNQLIYWGQALSGQTFATGSAALAWFATQSDKVCVNRDYEGIVISGLDINLDAGYTPSYPKIGNSWYDIGPVANNGSLANGPSYSSTNGGSLVFDGSDDYVQLSNYDLNNSFSYSVWAVRDGTGNQGTRGIVISNGSTYIDVGFSNGILFSLILSNGSQNLITYGTMAATGAWAHYAATYNQQSAILYLNGVQVASANYTLGVGKISPGFRIGGYDGGGFNLNGKISNAQVYRKALSATEVSQNYYAGLNSRFIVTSGLILNLQAGNPQSYPGTGTKWYDVSGNGVIGTLTNGPSYSSSNGGSFLFDGTDDYVSCGNLSTLNNMTVQMFVRVLSNAGGYKAFAGAYGSSGNDFDTGFNIDLQGGSSASFDRCSIEGGFLRVGGGTNLMTSSVAFGTWANICFTISPTYVQFYLNGVAQGGTNRLNNGSTTIGMNGLVIGARVYNLPATSINANIASTLIYNRALTAAEVLQNFNSQKSLYGL